MGAYAMDKCPKCGGEMIRAESGAALGMLGSSGPVRNLWRWYCPKCQYFPSGGSAWDGERIVTTEIVTKEKVVEYAKAAMSDQLSPELTRLLTAVRACLAESLRLEREARKYDGDFSVDFDFALAETHKAADALAAYNGGPLFEAYIALGQYLVTQNLVSDHKTPLWTGSAAQFAATAQMWHSIHFPNDEGALKPGIRGLL